MPKLIPGLGEKPKKRLTKKKALVVIIATIGLIAVVFAVFYVTARHPDGSGDQSVVTRAPISAEARAAISTANGKEDLGDIDGAAAVLDAELAKSTTVSDRTELLTTKGNILANDGRTDDGVKAVRQAIALDPTNSVLYKNLGSIYEVAGKKDDAVAVYKEGIKNIADGPKKTAQTDELNGAIARAQSNE